MKRLKLFLIFLLPVLALAQGHLIFTEMVLQPSAGEYVKIKNPTASTIDLSNYYITDGTDVAGSKYYYKITGGADFWSGSGSDFIARFPAVSITAGETITLALGRDSDYFAEYGENADLYLKGTGADTMLQAVSGQVTIGGSPNAKLDNVAETLILFKWDGSSSTVEDVDYLLWGNNSYAIDKNGVAGYAADTPVGSQSFMGVHIDGEKLIRSSETEGTETSSGGNGITGHDETSENLADTWTVSSLTSSRPVLGTITFSPDAPTDLDTLTITAGVTDAQGLSSVECVYTFGGSTTSAAMSQVGTTDNYRCEIMPLGAAGPFTYYIRAENVAGLKDSSLISNKTITEYVEPSETSTIGYLRDNYDDLAETQVTVTAMVTVEMGLINTYASYVQDDNGRGIYIFGSGMSGFARGSIVEITGTLSKYNDAMQIKDITATLVGSDTLSNVREMTCQQINNNFMQYEGSLVTVHGQVIDRADGIGGGSNITIDDGTASLTLRIWDSTNMLSNVTADTLLQAGQQVEVKGIVGFYSSAAQLMPAYASDVTPWTEGTAGTGQVSLTVAPYPFVPQLGEVIKYSYEYPDEARVIIRLYDAAGRYVTTLTDEFHGMSWTYEKTWNGRNEVGQFLPPGTYIMHMEVIERSTGTVYRKAQPVVIAVKK
jgi:DNA/RNA endonuclease YhcR with UshA esterase domain